MMIAVHLRHLLEDISSPFFIGMLLFALALVGLWLYGDSRRVRGCLLLSFIGLLLFSTGWVPGTVTTALENQYGIVTKVNPDIHWVVVLAGGHGKEVDGMPANIELSSASISRLVEGVRLYRQMPHAKLLLSGGIGERGETWTEAAYLATVASWFAIPARDMVLETSSFNTADEAVAVKKMVHNAPFYLVTSAVHMPRAMALFRQQGLHPIAAPTGLSFYWSTTRWSKVVLPNHRNLALTGTAWHEILGLLWAKIQGLL